MLKQLPAVKEVNDVSPDSLAEFLSTGIEQPVLFKGLINDWPAVKAGKASPKSSIQYLAERSEPMQVGVGQIPKQAAGRLFYNERFDGFNFERRSEEFSTFLETMNTVITQKNGDGHYMGSTSVDRLMPKFRLINDIGALASKSP